jgi:hypothetical protein
MINFYKFYNKTGLDKEHYTPLITRLMSGIYPGELRQISHIIIKQPNHSYWYAKNILKGRWKEAEQYIKEDDYWWGQYCRHFKLL